ncbi:hypothetical protein [Nonlabens ponticola]|uniref:Uncharacterized protein n=1 Tax=Nonlabens ponticola TaxID=2496866 RepID=A0A3S9MXM6_9FLAO|nr:hypothetical protein [Nonlabens ponticola]AZQ43894.1 hypothetical protein EJ995_06490 [Nonlabens ponticola]
MIRSLQFAIFFYLATGLGQINVGIEEKGTITPLKESFVEQLSNTTLIFVKPDYLEKQKLQSLIEEVWSISPFLIIDHAEFDPLEYSLPKYSVCRFSPNVNTLTTNGLMSYFANHQLDFYVWDKSKQLENLEELRLTDFDKEKYTLAKERMIVQSKTSFATVALHDNNLAVADINQSVLKDKKSSLVDEGLMDKNQDKLNIADIYTNVYKKDYYYNLDYGMLKNYLQAISDAIQNDFVISRYDNTASSELQNLKTNTLYIPSYTRIKLNILSSVYEVDKDFLIKKMKKYDHEYKVVDTDSINEKIMAGESFYYLRYVDLFRSQYIEVVQSQTGKVIFSNRALKGLFTKNLQSKHFKNLAKAIDDF